MMRSVRAVAAGFVLGVVALGSGGAASADDTDAPTVVRVGTEGTYAPFTFHDPATGDLTGYDIEVIEAVADEADWRLEFSEGPFDGIFPALDSGRVDVIANQITINPEREARYLFSTPYTYSRGVIVTAADNDDIKTLDDIKGKTAAQSETSNWAQVARDAGAEVQSVDQFSQAAELLVQGRVDVDRQRQHRRARLPRLDRLEGDQDRRRGGRRGQRPGADVPPGRAGAPAAGGRRAAAS